MSPSVPSPAAASPVRPDSDPAPGPSRYLAAAIAAFGIAGILLAATIFQRQTQHLRDLRRIADLHAHYRAFTEASERIKSGSDNLTKAVRRYAATGDRRFLDAYEEEANVARNREHAIDILERIPDVGTEARRMLRRSMAQSASLQADEARAMRLVADATGLPDESMPERLRIVALAPEDEALPPEAKRRRATELLYGDDYTTAKSAIWANANEFLGASLGRIGKDFDDATAAALRSGTRMIGFHALLVAIAAILVFSLLAALRGLAVRLAGARRAADAAVGRARLAAEADAARLRDEAAAATARLRDEARNARRDLRESLQQALDDRGSLPPPPPAFRSALVVDPHPASLAALEAALRRAGLPEVVTAGGPDDALALLRAYGSFDLVVTDLPMPAADGGTLFGHLRSNGGWRDIPVLGVSADEDALAAARGAGEIDAALPKPATAGAFSRAIAALASPKAHRP